MKVGILTQPLNHNYGGIIQNYALQKVLKDSGFQVQTLNHHIKKKGVLKRRVLRIIHIVKGVFLPLKETSYNYTPTAKESLIIEKNLRLFIEKYIVLSPDITNRKGFEQIEYEQQYDAYVVGSDQCWRPRYNNGYLKSMFLDFVKRDVKRIAYAVSFGSNIWEFSSNETKECSCLAKRFDLVTVREDSGVNLCKVNLKVNAMQVLDPTLLLTKEDYISLIQEEKEAPSQGLLFNYVLDPTAEKTSFIRRIEKETGYSSFQVLPKYYSTERTKYEVKNKIEDCVYPSVTKWLRSFMDAEMIVVDSFHGMVFSIIFNKPFWVIGNRERGLSRFSSLLKMLRLEKRLIDEKDFMSLNIMEPINWDEINAIICEKKQESKDLLLNALKDE